MNGLPCASGDLLEVVPLVARQHQGLSYKRMTS